MIVKMRKATIMVASKHLGKSLLLLRKLGVMHVEHLRQPSADAISVLERRIASVEEALTYLKENKLKVQQQDKKIDKDKALMCAREIISLGKKKQELAEQLQELKEQEKWFSEWGDVSLGSLSPLEKAGIFVKLYVCPKSAFKKIPQDKYVEVVKRRGSRLNLALISRQENASLDLPEVKIPSMNLHSLQRKLYSAQQKLQDAKKKLYSFSGHKHSLERCKQELEKRLEFYRVRFGAGTEEGFAYVQGFCPRESLAALKRVAEAEAWAYFFEEPGAKDEVPTLIRNPRWLNIVKPVFKLMDTIPGYREYDISFWFLLFFTLFVAMLIGDAGYGFIFLIATFFFHRKFRPASREIFFLVYVLSAATILWGIITGTWFGIEQVTKWPLLGEVVIPSIASFGHGDNQNFLIHLCFLIGAIHLSVAHTIVAMRFSNSARALSQLGWIAVVWGLFFYAEMLVLTKPLPMMANILMIAGVPMIMLFSEPGKGVLKSTLNSLGNIPLSLIASFSDVMSYLRLFAVGLATVAMAVSVNDLAFSFGSTMGNKIIGGFLIALVLFLGHSLNIVLAVMGVVVHGVRLNLLEFSGHLGIEWSGKEYKPFKEK